MKKFISSYWPSMLTLAAILYATLAKDPMGADELPLFPGADKLVHAIMMGGLTGAIAFDRQRTHRDRNLLTRRAMWTIAACVIVFGGMDELGQLLMDNGRGCDPLDFVADTVGAIAAVYLAPPAIRKALKIGIAPHRK